MLCLKLEEKTCKNCMSLTVRLYVVSITSKIHKTKNDIISNCRCCDKKAATMLCNNERLHILIESKPEKICTIERNKASKS